MESLIKQEEHNASLCVEAGDNQLASLSIIDKYDRFIQGDDSDEGEDSDEDYFPNESVLKKEIDQIKHGRSEKSTKPNSRLSLGLPAKYKTNELNTSLPNISALPRNGTTEQLIATKTELDSRELKEERSGVKHLKKLIEKLNTQRICGPDGNSIFCTEEELSSIQESYGAILDFLYEKSITTFEKKDSASISSPNETDDSTLDNTTTDLSLDKSSLIPHFEATQEVRDKFFLVEQQVRDLIEQLELVERYKMESL